MVNRGLGTLFAQHLKVITDKNLPIFPQGPNLSTKQDSLTFIYVSFHSTSKDATIIHVLYEVKKG